MIILLLLYRLSLVRDQDDDDNNDHHRRTRATTFLKGAGWPKSCIKNNGELEKNDRGRAKGLTKHDKTCFTSNDARRDNSSGCITITIIIILHQKRSRTGQSSFILFSLFLPPRLAISSHIRLYYCFIVHLVFRFVTLLPGLFIIPSILEPFSGPVRTIYNIIYYVHATIYILLYTRSRPYIILRSYNCPLGSNSS